MVTSTPATIGHALALFWCPLIWSVLIGSVESMWGSWGGMGRGGVHHQAVLYTEGRACCCFPPCHTMTLCLISEHRVNCHKVHYQRVHEPGRTRRDDGALQVGEDGHHSRRLSVGAGHPVYPARPAPEAVLSQ